MLPKAHRVRKTHEYDKIYRNSKRISSNNFLFYCRYISDEQKASNACVQYPRLGFVASKKVGNAIRRNKAKRLLRESVRLIFPTLNNTFEGILLASPNINSASFDDIQNEILIAFKKANIIKK